jgi:FKBP-type peptidyl-prolyl cis-trans isomerase SlyD
MTIDAGKVVAIHYTLRDADGLVLDDSGDGDPLLYLHGAGNIVPGLEDGLTGKDVGDKVKIEVQPEQGYGTYDPEGVQVLGRDDFPDDVEIEVGMHFGAEGPDGDVVPAWVTRVDGDQLTIDLNHPLAGKTLHFEVSIEGVRDATADESRHGHPHEEGGSC